MAKTVAAILEEILARKPNSLRGDELLSSLNLDSLDTVTLIADVDTIFGVTISPGQLSVCRCVNDLESLIKSAKRSAA